MLSLLSDEYRGKTQGLRIGAAIVDSTDIKANEVKASIVTTDAIYPETTYGEINLWAGALNRQNTYFHYEYGTLTFQVLATNNNVGTSLSLDPTVQPKSFNQTNFLQPWTEGPYGFTESFAFTEPSLYNVSLAIKGTNSAQPVTMTLVSTDPSNGQHNTKLVDTVLGVGNTVASCSGTWKTYLNTTVLGVTFFSATGATTVSNAVITITVHRINS